MVKEPSISDKITEALDSRTQKWLVNKIKQYSENVINEPEKFKLWSLTDVMLSRKMNGHSEFEPYELKAISKILKIKL